MGNKSNIYTSRHPQIFQGYSYMSIDSRISTLYIKGDNKLMCSPEDVSLHSNILLRDVQKPIKIKSSLTSSVKSLLIKYLLKLHRSFQVDYGILTLGTNTLLNKSLILCPENMLHK